MVTGIWACPVVGPLRPRLSAGPAAMSSVADVLISPSTSLATMAWVPAVRRMTAPKECDPLSAAVNV